MKASRFLDLLPSPFPPARNPIAHEMMNPDLALSKPPQQEVRPANTHAIKLSEHWAVVGASGSGKTYFIARGLLEYLRRMYPDTLRYVIDSTNDVKLPQYIGEGRVRHYQHEHPPALTDGPEYTVVWSPPMDNPGHYENFLSSILYARNPAIVVIDELASLAGYARTAVPPESYIRLLKQGRKHGITVVTGSQSIQRVPEPVFTQMTHYAQFRIGISRYAHSMARMYLNHGEDEEYNYSQPVGKYGFWYRRTDGNFLAREFAGMSSFFKHSPL